ncbi:hypothetical protein SD81_014715 [Tolypothrix campylonemoides VB511288]|nr:hypothetical protein SD81_014715 [Tolypothrix campylonemoides VB511288]
MLISADFGEKKELLRLEQKLDKAIELLSGDKPVSVKDSLSLESSVTNVVEEWLQKNSNSNKDIEVKLRDKLQNFQDISETARHNVEKRKEFDSIASEWLKLRCNSLKELGIRNVLSKNIEMKEAGGLLYPQDKITQLNEDIDKLLKILVTSLSTHQHPSLSETITLKLPTSVYLDVLKVIWEEVIPKYLNSEPEQISNEALNRLKGYFLLLRDELKQMQSL